MPASLERLGRALPSAIMAVLIIYCMKDIPTGGISAAVPKLLAAAVVFITYKWKHQTLVSILLGTISYMMLLRLFLKRNGAVLNSWQKFRIAPFFYSLYALEGLAIIR